MFTYKTPNLKLNLTLSLPSVPIMYISPLQDAMLQLGFGSKPFRGGLGRRHDLEPGQQVH
jgi:hypothetical protein